MDDLSLIKRIRRSGDRAAADELIRRYYDEIHSFVRRQAPLDVALDLTQEIFISILRTVGRFDGKDATFRTWLYRVAANKVVDRYRSTFAERQTAMLSLDEVEPADSADFARELENSEFTQRVCARVGELPRDTQQVFRLHIFGGQTLAEIAKDLQMPENSVKTKYYRLINLLRKEFSDYE